MFRLCIALFLLCLPSVARAQAEPGKIAEASTGKTFTNSLGMRLVELPDTPVLISIWETRVSDWDAYVKAKNRTWTRKPAFAQSPQHPVVSTTLAEAVEFCTWLTEHERKAGVLRASQAYRLPSKAEWDAAAGSTSDSNQTNASYPWGDAWPPSVQSGNYAAQSIEDGMDDGFEFTAPVGQFPAARSGCHDLGGNVWEWTSDVAPDGKMTAALRGGSWMYWRRECLETQYVYPAPAGTRSPGIGFRCVLEDADEAARLERERQERASKLMEKSVVDQKEIDEMKRKLSESPVIDQNEAEEAKRKLMEKPAVDQQEIEEVKRKLRERKLPPAGPNPKQDSPSPTPTEETPAKP